VTPELHRPVTIDRVDNTGLDMSVEANEAECSALAVRMKLPDMRSLTCDFHLEREFAGAFLAHGHLRARVVQTCVVSLEDFTNLIEEHFAVRLVPEGQESDDDPESLDEIPYHGETIDLGEVAAEQLALALDPYPRAPGAELPTLPDDAEWQPFAALDALRRRQ
jgi:uncharacterized metal-binding protein YceD (DUF177 family)